MASRYAWKVAVVGIVWAALAGSCWLFTTGNVSFETNGAGHIPSQQVTGTINDPPDDPIKEGYTFEGWYSDPNFSEESLWDFENDVVEGEITLYAKWAVNSIALSVTGQKTVYKAGDDGDLQEGIEWPDPRFTDNGNGTITDNLTGLIWLKNADLLLNYGNATWSEVLAFVEDINTHGKIGIEKWWETDAEDTSNSGSHQTDWRLPNRNEFESIMTLETGGSFSNIPEWLEDQGFEGISTTNRYWTSTTYPPTAEYPDHAWHAQIYEGRIRHWSKEDNSGPMMLVRGNGNTALNPAPVWKTGQKTVYINGDDGALQEGIEWPDPRFTDNGSGTITDNLTGLIWLKNANCAQTSTDWATAFTYIAELNNQGTMNGENAGDTSNTGSHQTDWRLPNRKELFTLLDMSQLNPALPNGNPFTTIGQTDSDSPVPGWYWTSSTDDLNTLNAWEISLGSGSVSRTPKTGVDNYILPVRGTAGNP